MKTKDVKTKNVLCIKEYKGIRDLIYRGKYTLALKALEQYLEKYPGNTYALKEYASILRQQGKCREALEVLDGCDGDYVHNIREKSLCYLYLGEYEKALEEISRLRFSDSSTRQIHALCESRLGIYQGEEDNNHSYTIHQILDYDREKALEHIKTHQKGREDVSYFQDNLDLEELFINIETILPVAKQLYTGRVMTEYLFQIPHVGYTSQGKEVNYLRVVTIPNSYQVLTMFPNDCFKTNIINNYEELLLTKTDQHPTKVLVKESQIEKFYRRYGK